MGVPSWPGGLQTALDGITELGPGWRRLGWLFFLGIASTVFEGFGLGLLLPVAQLLQGSGDVTDALRHQGYWQYLAKVSDWAGVPLTLWTLVAASLILFMIRNAIMYVRTVATARSSQQTIRNIRVRGFALFLRTSSGYQDRMSAGKLASDLTVQAGTASGAIHALVTLAQVGFMAAYYFCFLLLLSWQITTSILVVIVVAAFCVRPITKHAKIVGERLVRANQAASSFLIERLGAVRLIRLAQTEKSEIDEMSRRANKQAAGEVAITQYSARTSIVMESVVIIFCMALLYFGKTMLGLELATVGLTLVILLRQLPVAREFVVARQAIVSNLPSTAHLVALFRDMENVAEPETGSTSAVRLHKAITLHGVVFRYDANSEPALRGIDAVFPAHKMSALVGPSGGGKSTMIDLLPGLRDPEAGEIRIDGTPLRTFTRSALRTLVAYTPQTPQIFNITIAEHIRYGRPAATQDEVCEAARLAGASDFIEQLPGRYDTMLGERGVRLSGGQKQRIDLARALVSGADVLILDEPTSNIDAEAEFNFEQMLQGLRTATQRTIIVVAHRLSTVRNADQIIVIQHGKVGETGSHAQLVKNGGWYARACRMQANGPELLDAE
jgi:ATP-binding cassette, subfamily B, bacterial MsbA